MATITERFGFTKPTGSEAGDVDVINSNTDLTELYLGRTQDMIAPMYDDTATYDVGDIVTYESKLYKCITAIATPETFDPTKWEATTASEDILTLQNVQGYDEYDETQTYAVGDYAIYNNIVYECTTAVSTAEPFDSTKWTATSIKQIIDGVKGDVSQLNSSKVSKVNTGLTLTRTENDYVDATSFARLGAFRKDNVLFFICNLSLTSSISAPSDFVEIGRISDWSGIYTIMQSIPSQQSDGSSLLISISQNGIISIYSVKATSSFYRTVVSIPAKN
jgi:hypothetical protein